LTNEACEQPDSFLEHPNRGCQSPFPPRCSAYQQGFVCSAEAGCEQGA
jgi:hypothetical protein